MASIAETLMQNAQQGAKESGQTVGNAIEAYGAMSRLENAKQQLEVQKKSNDTARATAFLSQMDTLSRMTPQSQDIAIKSLSSQWRQMYPNMNPDLPEVLKRDKEFRGKMLQTASNALMQVRNGKPLTEEGAAAINALPGLQTTDMFLEVDKYAQMFNQQQLADKMGQSRLEVAQTKADAVETKPSAGEQKRDKDFATKWAEFNDAGGRAEFDKNVTLLDSALTELESGKIKTGGLKGAMGDTAMDLLDPKVAALRSKVQNAVIGMLRPTLGAQFAQKEGEKIMDLKFNPRFDAKTIAEGIRTEVEARRAQVVAIEKAGKIFEKSGTLANRSGAKAPAQGGGKQPPGGVMQKKQNGVIYDWNPQTGRYE